MFSQGCYAQDADRFTSAMNDAHAADQLPRNQAILCRLREHVPRAMLDAHGLSNGYPPAALQHFFAVSRIMKE
jgi:hypothetical protein